MISNKKKEKKNHLFLIEFLSLRNLIIKCKTICKQIVFSFFFFFLTEKGNEVIEMEAQRSMFSRLIEMPADAPVFDLTGKENNVSTWGIGKYNEKRPYIYQTELFSPTTQNARNIHIGIDLFAPVNTPLFSVADGKILHFGYNPAAGTLFKLFF